MPPLEVILPTSVGAGLTFCSELSSLQYVMEQCVVTPLCPCQLRQSLGYVPFLGGNWEQEGWVCISYLGTQRAVGKFSLILVSLLLKLFLSPNLCLCR